MDAQSPPADIEVDQADQQQALADARQPIAGSPSDFLKNIVGKKVKVRIGSGVDYTGMSTLAVCLAWMLGC
jgi:hypothetical protein